MGELHEFDHVDSFVATAVGEPGSRVFYLHARAGATRATVRCEKQQVGAIAQYLRRVSDKTQFIVITHRRGTMEAANVLYGVTMQEDGVSKLLKLDLEHVDATLVS